MQTCEQVDHAAIARAFGLIPDIRGVTASELNTRDETVPRNLYGETFAFLR